MLERKGAEGKRNESINQAGMGMSSLEQRNVAVRIWAASGDSASCRHIKEVQNLLAGEERTKKSITSDEVGVAGRRRQ